MPSRIHAKLLGLRAAKRKALATYIVAGDPSPEVTVDLVLELERCGADIIELGVPFSDPMADGPVIQKASERALKNGMTLAKTIATVAAIRRHSQIPILLMGYYNPILQFGLKKFALAARSAGVDGVLVVDLPVEESEELNLELRQNELDQIFLLTPTSDAKRATLIAERGSGFAYYVSLTGVTGAATLDPKDVSRQLSRLRRHVALPILVGFGISGPEQVRQLAPFADGVVVGSAILKIMGDHPIDQMIQKVGDFITSLNAALQPH